MNRIIDGMLMNIVEVTDVQPHNKITLKFMGSTETLDCADVALIPPTYELYHDQIWGIKNWELHRKITVERRLKVPGKQFSEFRKKLMGWDAWSAFQDQAKSLPKKRPLLPLLMEEPLRRGTPWPAHRDSEGNYYPCSCCPDCVQQAARD